MMVGALFTCVGEGTTKEREECCVPLFTCLLQLGFFDPAYSPLKDSSKISPLELRGGEIGCYAYNVSKTRTRSQDEAVT